jgi:hypothetical protein
MPTMLVNHRIRDNFFPDPGSPTHISESLVTIFGVKLKNTSNLFQLANIYSVSVHK